MSINPISDYISTRDEDEKDLRDLPLSLKVRDVLVSDAMDSAMKVVSTLVAHKGSPKARFSVGIYSVISTLAVTFIDRSTVNKNAAKYSMTVDSDDFLYHLTKKWLADNLPAEDHKRIQAYFGDKYDVEENKGLEVIFLSSDEISRTFIYQGHKILVRVDKSEDKAEGQMPYSKTTIMFVVESLEARDVLKTLAAEIANTADFKRLKSQVFMPNRYGSWRNDTASIVRKLDSVILKENLVEDVRSDLCNFLNLENKYVQAGLPWHRGYLLHGPPGTGKTSLVRALGSELDLNVYYISLSNVKNDDDFLGLMSYIQPRSILLLEDVDVAGVTLNREEDNSKDGLTLSGLLNGLDGLGTPHGLITFMTSNFPEVIDDALLRTGRIDRKFEIDYAHPQQTYEIIKSFTGVTLDIAQIPELLVPAEVVEKVKQSFSLEDHQVEEFISCEVYNMINSKDS